MEGGSRGPKWSKTQGLGHSNCTETAWASFQKCLPLSPFWELEGDGTRKKGPLDTREVLATLPATCTYLKVGLIISILHLRKQAQRH